MVSRQAFLSGLIVSASLLLALEGRAAPPLQATARAEQSNVQLGAPARILIQVKNSEGVPDIETPQTEGVSISATGTAVAMPSALRNVRPLATGHTPGQSLVQSLRELSKQLADDPALMGNNGDPQLTKQYQMMLGQSLGNLSRDDLTIVYLANPEKLGAVTVPPFTVRSGGQTVRTEPIRLIVTEPRPQPWVKAALSLSNPNPLAGEEVSLYADLLVRRWPKEVGRNQPKLKSQPIHHVTLYVPTLEGLPEVRPVQSLEEFVAKRRLPSGQLGYHVNNYPGVILLEQEPPAEPGNTLDPQWYRRRLTFPFRTFQAGEVEVPPLRVAGEVWVPSGGKGGYKWEGFVTSSQPLKFHIANVANRPADYNGTIGPCRLVASASRTEMPAGTPFTLTLRETGRVNLVGATRPNLEAIPGFRDHFIIHPENDVLLSRNEREFTWTLRPRSEAVTEVPAISLSWYDPRGERFERVHSNPIPLHITPAPRRPESVPHDSPDAGEGTSSSEDESDTLVRRSFPSGIALAGGAAGIIILAAVFAGIRRRGKRRRDALRLRRRATEQARQRLRAPALTVADVSAAVQDFLRAHLKMPAGEITPEEAIERLRQEGYAAELSEACAEVLRECAARRFAAASMPSAAGDLATAADRVLHDILAASPQRPKARATPGDELTRQRQAALAD